MPKPHVASLHAALAVNNEIDAVLRIVRLAVLMNQGKVYVS